MPCLEETSGALRNLRRWNSKAAIITVSTEFPVSSSLEEGNYQGRAVSALLEEGEWRVEAPMRCRWI